MRGAGTDKAFTLAEILITLGIIGIVASLTLPALINNHRKKVFETKFKKGYSTLQNAYIIYSGINGHNISNFVSENEWYQKKENIVPFIDSFQYGTKSYGNLVPVNGIVDSEISYKYWASLLKYNGTPINRLGISRGSVEVADGATFTIFNNGAVRNEFIIILDTNGAGSKPNRIGYDTFFFTILNNKIIPIAPSKSISIVLDPQGAGYTYYAVLNVCPADSTKTYWECLEI